MSSGSGDGGSDSSGQADWMRSGLNADASPRAGVAHGRGRSHFARLPGVVAAAGALAVALGVGLVVTTVGGGSDDGNGSALGPPTSETFPKPAPSAAPASPSGHVPDQIDPGRVPAALGDTPVDDEVFPLMRSCADADARACTSLGDALVERCYRGDGFGCDLLYEVTTVGSAYETYAATCGGRVDIRSAGTCRQVDMSIPPQPQPPQ
jgi:hypothetical protein